jgi:hypothetical protein
MLGFELTIRDYLTFATAAVAGVAVIVIQLHLAPGGSFDAAASVAELAGGK